MDILETYTKDAKKKVLKDWQDLFPYLGKLGTRKFYNRLGPIIVGITIDIDSVGFIYIPIYNVHNLCRQFPGITLTLNIEERSISPSKHDVKFNDAAKRLIEKAFIPLEGNVHLDDVIQGYEEYFKNPRSGGYVEFEDIALICGWCGDDKKTDYVLNRVKSILSKWPEERYFRHVGGFEKWFNDLEKRAKNKEELRAICEKQIIELRLNKLPVREIIY